MDGSHPYRLAICDAFGESSSWTPRWAPDTEPLILV